MLLDFPRFLHMQLREALDTMPAQDLPDVIRQLVKTSGSALREELLGDYAEWGPHEENTAQLLDIRAYELELAWADRTIDPNDQDVRRDRLEAKRRGIKPPEHPIVPPVAHRPGDLAQERLQQYLDKIAAQQTDTEPKTGLVSMREFNAQMGLVAGRG